jgi:hypothetical protein
MRYALIYGALAGAVTICLIILTLVLELPDHLHSEWFGYLVMLVALSMIFVGVKRYRDVERGGVIRFVPALGVGLGIAVVAALIYVIGWEIFLATNDSSFIAEYMREYLAGMVRDMQAEGATPAAIQAKITETEGMVEAYKNPLFRMPLTFVEIFPVGLLVALVSAAILRNPRVLPARAAAA